MDSESCTRAFSQARVYLEHIRSRVAAGGVDIHGPGKRDYLLDAAKQIRLALERDVSEDYEEAFNHYKNGVDVLLNGVQVDPNKERREAVKRKITQYLKRAEEIFNCHLQRTLGNGTSTETGYSSLRFRPIRTLSAPLENLRRCKVVGIVDKVQIVQDPATGGIFILKSLPKSHVENRERQTIIPHGIPFMAKLLCYSVSDDSIFLQLEHVKGGMLWSHLRSHPCFQHDSCNFSSTSSLEVKLALGGASEEGLPQEANSGTQKICNFCLENRSGQRTSCINHSLPRSTDYSLSWMKPCDHLNTHQQYIAPVFGSRGVLGGKNLSMTYTLSGATESNFKQVCKEPCQQAKQRLTFLSSDSLTTVDNSGSISEKGASQQEPKQRSGDSSNQSSLKAARGCSMTKAETPCCRVSRFAHSLASLTGQRQVYPETLQQNCCAQENGWNSTPTREGGSLVRREYKQHRNKPAPRDCLSPAQHVPQSDSFGICDINENQIRLWAAELILALEGLHQQGILCKDLNPRNVLLDDMGHICLTYFGQWTEVEPQFCSQALEELYCAPEVGGISELTEACDWWSLGALLYELLSGTSLSQIHPSGIHRHTQLHLPEKLNQCASSLLTELLQYDPEQRLGSGEDGVSKIKSHPFFSTIQWNKLVAY